MKLSLSKISDKKGKKEEKKTVLESFSFNFKLNAGIHGKSNIGVKVCV